LPRCLDRGERSVKIVWTPRKTQSACFLGAQRPLEHTRQVAGLVHGRERVAWREPNAGDATGESLAREQVFEYPVFRMGEGMPLGQYQRKIFATIEREIR
jgi:hypothetical protein